MQNVTKFPALEQERPAPGAGEQKVGKENLIEYLRVFGFEKSLSNEETGQFIQTALSGNLDPFKREIYIALYGEGENRKISFLTGYQVYLKRAERTGKLDGWGVRIEGEGSRMKAVVEIFRKDWSHSFIHEAHWEEAVQKRKNGEPTQFWAKQPRFQLRKVAVAQAFRLAFPDELGGLPYETAEMPEPATENVPHVVPANDGHLHSETGDVKTSTRDSKTGRLADEALGDSRFVSGNATAERIKQERATSTPQKAKTADIESGFLENAVWQIENMFDENPDDFTEKHQAWILDKVHKADDRAGVNKMVAYTRKVAGKAA